MKRQVTKIFLFLFILFPANAGAVTMTSSSYTNQSQIAISAVSDPGNRLTIYNLAYPDAKYCQTNKNEIDEIGGVKLTCVGEFVDFDLGNFSIIESSATNLPCNFKSYEQCKALPSFLNEALFSLSAPSSSPTPTPTPTPVGLTGAPKAYRPEVSIDLPKFLQVSSSTVFIKYQATDKNDEDSPELKKWLGMGESPVSIYYSPDSDIRKRVLIAKDLPAVGGYSWNSIGVKEGDTYFVIVSATDKTNETGEAQTGPFTIDHSVPLFTVRTEPGRTKGEDVTIQLQSSKALVEMPTLRVAQKNFIPTAISLSGSTTTFQGVYKVVSGYDGEAVISVSGRDNLNNVSSKIVSGGSFSVGDLAPPKPVILSLKDGDVVTNGYVRVVGEARSDTEVILTMNGGKNYRATPDTSGRFVFDRVTLDKNLSGGKNFLNLVSRDRAGNTSQPISLGVIVSSPVETPAIEIKDEQVVPERIVIPATDAKPIVARLLYPRDGRGVGGVAEIVWEADEESSIKSATLSYRRANGPYRAIASNVVNPKILWDVRGLPEGRDYELKLEVTDGRSMTELVRKIVVDNTPPSISVSGSVPDPSSDTFSLTATGQATDALSGIEFVEYSLDGEHWFKADITEGHLQNRASFSLRYPYKLEDGIYAVKYRALDGAGNSSSPSISNISLNLNPPRVGSYEISRGNIVFSPSPEQKFEILQGEAVKFRLSLEKDTVDASLQIGEEVISLEKDGSLWSATIELSNSGSNELMISAKDRSGRTIENRQLGVIEVLSPGTTEPGADISVFVLNEEEKRYVRWQGEEFGQSAGVISDSEGKYKLLLPSGKYFLKVRKNGFERLRSDNFELNRPAYITTNFKLEEAAGFRKAIEGLIDKFIIDEN